MRSAFVGLCGLSALLLSQSASAAVKVLCHWEGGPLVAITVEGEATAFSYYRYHGGSYYDIEVKSIRDLDVA